MLTPTVKIFAAAALAGSLVAGALPAAAAVRCGCPVVHHHTHHRVYRHPVVYRREVLAPPAETIYREAPPEPVYEPAPAYYSEPAYYGGYAGYAYYGGPSWYGGWGGHGYRGYYGDSYRGFAGGFHGR